MSAQSRMDVLVRQLTSDSLASHDLSIQTDFSSQQLSAFLVHDNPELRTAICNFLRDPLYEPNYYLSLMEFRELTLQRLKKFVDQKFFSVYDYMSNPRRFMAALETLSLCDYSLAIKSGVHFTLCGGTICKLGTKKHHDAYLPKLDNLSLTGCYGMTELGHGSNVMGIETTATYDTSSQEFVINTPNDQASKFWIGGAAQHGKVCTVFCQLTVNGKWEGPHVFVVRIRDDNLQLMPGVRIEDNGAKMGLNGVDNGRIWFYNVRVPKDSLLDAFASVDASGKYTSSISSVSKRFGTMVAGLTTGRILIASGGVDAAKIGLTVAIRYGLQRTQFGSRVIMTYITHQRRLLPALANTYALHFGLGYLKRIAFDNPKSVDPKEIHILSSGLKAAATWSRVSALQDARECCGGMGFLAANKIGVLKTDMDVDTTFEGDNTVLMQQVAKGLLEDWKPAREQSPARRATGGTDAFTPELLLELLRAREEGLLSKVGQAMVGAASVFKGSPAKSAAASAAAYDAHLDTVVAIGWAHIEHFLLENLLKAAEGADLALRPVLRLLARLYGASRLELRAADCLATGLLSREEFCLLRLVVNEECGRLTADNGALALKLCDAFAIPDHLLQAPIAFDWKSI